MNKPQAPSLSLKGFFIVSELLVEWKYPVLFFYVFYVSIFLILRQLRPLKRKGFLSVVLYNASANKITIMEASVRIWPSLHIIAIYFSSGLISCHLLNLL